MKQLRVNNYQLTINRGFSLVEVIISIAILSVVGGLIVGILSRTYSGSNKTTLIGNIKQNGQSALNALESNIRRGEVVVCPQTTTPDVALVVQNKDGSYTRFRFVPPASGNNGYIDQDTLPLSDPALALGLCAAPANAPFALTDQNSKTGISIISGTFTVNKIRGSQDIVTIAFDAGPGVNSGSGFDNTIAGDKITFQTSVQLR